MSPKVPEDKMSTRELSKWLKEFRVELAKFTKLMVEVKEIGRESYENDNS